MTKRDAVNASTDAGTMQHVCGTAIQQLRVHAALAVLLNSTSVSWGIDGHLERPGVWDIPNADGAVHGRAEQPPAVAANREVRYAVCMAPKPPHDSHRLSARRVASMAVISSRIPSAKPMHTWLEEACMKRLVQLQS